MSDRTTGGGAVVVGVVVALIVLSVVMLAAAWVGVRADAQVRARVAAMPTDAEPAAMWPLAHDEAAGPYLRGATVASVLTGRR